MAKRIPQRKLFWVVLALILVGLGLWKFVFSNRKTEIETYRVERGTVTEELILSGEIAADKYAALAFPVSGKIIWVGVSEGQEVRKGQALAKIDTTSLNAAYQRARADLRAAEASLDKVHDDLKNHSSDETWTQRDTRTAAEAAKDKAYEAVLIAEQNLRDATLIAPFDGLVTSIANPNPGVSVLYTQTQVEILNPETIYFEVAADQSEVVKLAIGQRVNVVLDSFSNQPLEGEATYISLTPKIEESGTVYKVKVKFLSSSSRNQIRVGMTGDAKFVLSQAESVLYAPPQFIKSDKKGKYVNLGKKNNKVYIEIGIEGEERVEIKSGVKEGDILFD